MTSSSPKPEGAVETRRFVPIRFWWGWAVWDRARGRLSDGIYAEKEVASEVAAGFNARPQRGDRDWYGTESGNHPLRFSPRHEYYGLKDEEEEEAQP